MIKTEKDEILDTLFKFQKGYSEKNLKNIDQFAEALFVNSEATVIVGTGNGEKCAGIEEIKELLEVDWAYWGNFELNINDALITHHDEIAWVIADGTLSKPTTPKLYDNCVKKVKSILEAPDTAEERLFASLKSIAYSLHESKIGNGICRPVRFTGILKKENDIWKFIHIHFSYPVAPPTDVKILKA